MYISYIDTRCKKQGACLKKQTSMWENSVYLSGIALINRQTTVIINLDKRKKPDPRNQIDENYDTI